MRVRWAQVFGNLELQPSGRPTTPSELSAKQPSWFSSVTGVSDKKVKTRYRVDRSNLEGLN